MDKDVLVLMVIFAGTYAIVKMCWTHYIILRKLEMGIKTETEKGFVV